MYIKHNFDKYFVVVRMGTNFASLLENRREFYVHSIFDRAINLSDGQEFLTLLPLGRGGGESYATVAVGLAMSFRSCSVFPGYKVEVEAGKLVRLAPSVIADFSSSLPWESPLKSIRGLPTVREDRLGVLYSTLLQNKVESPFKGVLEGDKPELGILLDRIRLALLEEDTWALEEGLGAVIGWGPGLTPSGDDFISGLSLVRGFLRKVHGLSGGMWEERVRAKVKQTNPLSAFFIKEALRGHAHEYVEEVVASLLDERGKDVREAIARLLSIGATSGFDIGVGIYFALKWQRRYNWCLKG